MQNEWLNQSVFIMASMTKYHQWLEMSWISRAATISVTGLPSPWPSFLSIVLLISSCDQVCNTSWFASVPEGKLRIRDDDDDDDDDDEDFEGDSFDQRHGDKEQGISWRYSR